MIRIGKLDCLAEVLVGLIFRDLGHGVTWLAWGNHSCIGYGVVGLRNGQDYLIPERTRDLQRLIYKSYLGVGKFVLWSESSNRVYSTYHENPNCSCSAKTMIIPEIFYILALPAQTQDLADTSDYTPTNCQTLSPTTAGSFLAWDQ